MKTFNCFGYWWFPEEPEKTLLGELNFMPGEGAILILSEFSDRTIDIFKKARKFPKYYNLVLGVLSDGRKITLYKNHIFSSTGAYGGVEKEDVSTLSMKSRYMFVGHHFQTEEDIRFKLVSVQYSFLDEWINKPLVINKRTQVLDKPEPISLTKKGDFKIFVDFEKSSPFSSLREFTIKQKAFIIFESFKSGNSWVEYENLIHHMQNFLTLATMMPVKALRIEGKIKKDKIRKIKWHGHLTDYPVTYANIKIYITNSDVNELTEDIKVDDMLFSYPEIKKVSNYIMLNWFVNSSLFSSIYNAYFGTTYKKDDMFLENKFLNIITVIESFHRSNTSNIEIDEYSHEQRLKSVLDSVPGEYKEWIAGKLRHSNEPTLRTRLKEIMGPYPDIFRSKKRIKRFIGKVLDNRNSLVHSSTERSIDPEQLYFVTKILQIVFELYLLKHMGFEVEEIKNLINKKKSKNPVPFQYWGMV